MIKGSNRPNRARTVPAMIMLGLMTLTPLAITGCEEEGPAEKAGEQIDEAVKDAGRAVKDATD